MTWQNVVVARQGELAAAVDVVVGEGVIEGELGFQGVEVFGQVGDWGRRRVAGGG